MTQVGFINHDLARRESETRLVREFDGALSAETVAHYMMHCMKAYEAHAKIQNFVPILAERAARQQLRALARLAGHDSGTTEILFAGTHNTGRSQMAMGFLQHLVPGGDDATIVGWSVGSEPRYTLNDEVAAVMAEVGAPIDADVTHPWTPEIAHTADHIVLLDKDLDAPLGVRATIHRWDLPHASGLNRDELRAMRDRIGRLVTDLVNDIQDASGEPR